VSRNLSILGVIAVIVALPFVFRQSQHTGDWRAGDPVIVVVTPHNEAIRYEFEAAFSRWHRQRFGKPVKIDWRNIGGTTEINRYLNSEFTASTRAWWKAQGKRWPDGMTDALTASRPPADPALAEIHAAARAIDDPAQISTNIDIFFGGGEFDHSAAFRSGVSVACGDELPQELFVAADGTPLIPERVSGEVWRTPYMFGNVVSTFGIVYNIDRLRDLGIAAPPHRWDDLADPRYFRQVGLADPTKSGSVAKAFELIVHQKMHDAVRAAGFSEDQIEAAERDIAAFQASTSGAKRGEVPEPLRAYQQALENGFEDGLALVQSIGANARYFTDSGSKVPIDVSMGDAAVGMAIDFYGRYQAQNSAGPDGRERMVYVPAAGGTSVSCDPISLLRGAPNRQTALRFIEFVLSEDGQRLWTYKPGTPGGPEKYALRRLPIRRDFYPSTNPAIQAAHLRHAQFAADDIGHPDVDPYALAEHFVYRRRWTGEHFGFLREIVRAMCLDSGDELRRAWAAIHRGTSVDPTLLRKLRTLPAVRLTTKEGAKVEAPLNWQTAPDFRRNFDPLEYMREWTAAFRHQYQEVAREAVR